MILTDFSAIRERALLFAMLITRNLRMRKLNSHTDKSMLLFKELRDDGEDIRTSGQARCRMQPMGKPGTGQIFGSWCQMYHN